MFQDHINNPFESARISNANLSTFAEKHAALLSSFSESPELLRLLPLLSIISNFN